ncbi:hypothetical protein TRIATDRAFT_295093 [Trichoderma atroviride IMI 206040]|uniref:T6SS Phospholipase effector Tle1-like catalytic domain-containing protein n=1 Tax=Hypocrea atroviridis (strain ATCC 20476 / IMI 206040) TaxID=452589 RepID=G9P4C9_HYPAI|nr:uncharacterized protein TRIATDRAFT_295093 [Trichoderma atroviride IMI 206040]EHK41130.1 hypothetical protein TRIATDRAFT_295093 [Trichoderma atroviride IMI 206040]
MGSQPPVHKRLIVCCDGTWMNSDNGYNEPTLGNPQPTLQVPSNVTRISRCFKRRCQDGTLQVMTYESGVGTGSNAIDTFTGGAFGLGLSERVRDAYSYLCVNHIDGDEIFLVGFSRGAFTARSVAGMVGNLGLLTREGLEYFYPIFKDMENWNNDGYKDEFPGQPFDNKPKGPNAAAVYRERLEKLGYTRVYQENGDLIKIKAVCVWDTVGSLGIPKIPWLEKIGIHPANKEYRWHDTSLSDRIEHAFQALALDETRAPFSPAVWERLPQNKMTTELRQVWFPGNHGNCGGGWPDQEAADASLAWMMDQMASVGVEFDLSCLERVAQSTISYYKNQKAASKKGGPKWAIDPIYSNNQPVRPWALGSINKAGSFIYKLAGFENRTPGLYKRTDPKTDRETNMFLQDTNERIHCSARIRLACKGLGLDDKAVWTCPSLANWQLKHTTETYKDPIPQSPSWWQGPPDESGLERQQGRWIWEYAGPKSSEPADPKQRIMVEEPLGPHERYLLQLSAGTPNVYLFAETQDIVWQGKTIPAP